MSNLRLEFGKVHFKKKSFFGAINYAREKDYEIGQGGPR
jgi:hypothetical protein